MRALRRRGETRAAVSTATVHDREAGGHRRVAWASYELEQILAANR
jgi:hypothetical protein